MTEVAQTASRRSGIAEDGQYLTFVCNGEVFAIEILIIKEIIEYGHLTTVPMMPEYIRGVINLRGAVVPVVDLSARFGRGPSVPGKRTCIVIIEAESEQGCQVIGVIVDAVNEVLEIAAGAIEPPPSFGAHLRNDFIRGMGKVQGRFVIILATERVLSVAELADLQTVSATSRSLISEEIAAAA